MSDPDHIANDLRAPCSWCNQCPACRGLMGEAADEIERLRANWLTEQKARLENATLLEMYSAVKAKTEIERLRAELDTVKAERDKYKQLASYANFD